MDGRDLVGVPKFVEGGNFTLWRYHIEIIFKAKELMEVVDGTLTLNGLVGEQALQWRRKNVLARAILVGAVDERQLEIISKCPTAHSMCSRL